MEISSSSFLEKEKDLQNKIEELERRVEEINHNSAFQKVSSSMLMLMRIITLKGVFFGLSYIMAV